MTEGFSLWTTPAKAAALGCTHRACFFGLIPGFINPDDGLWVSRSDLLAPIEDALAWAWCITRELRGEEPDFMFAVGGPIAAQQSEE